MKKSLADYVGAGCAVEFRKSCEGRTFGFVTPGKKGLYVRMLIAGDHCIPAEKISMKQVSKIYGKYTVANVMRSLHCSEEDLLEQYDAFAEIMLGQTPLVDTDSVIYRMLEAGDVVEARLYGRERPVKTLMLVKERTWGMCLQDLSPDSNVRWIAEYIPDCRISHVYRGISGISERMPGRDYENLKRQVAECEPLISA